MPIIPPFPSTAIPHYRQVDQNPQSRGFLEHLEFGFIPAINAYALPSGSNPGFPLLIAGAGIFDAADYEVGRVVRYLPSVASSIQCLHTRGMDTDIASLWLWEGGTKTLVSGDAFNLTADKITEVWYSGIDVDKAIVNYWQEN